MTDIQDQIKQFMRGEYNSFDDIKVEEKKKNLSVCIVAFKNKLNAALAAIDEAKEKASIALNEGAESLNTLTESVHSEKMQAIVEGYTNTQTMLGLECDENDIANCKNALTVISENFDCVLGECGIEMDEPPVDDSQEGQVGEFENIVFKQGDDATEAFEILDTNGEEAVVDHLKPLHSPGSHETREDLGEGTQDTVNEYPSDDGTYYLVYNRQEGYIGLSFSGTGEDAAIEEPTEEPTGIAETFSQSVSVAPAAVTADSLPVKPEPLQEEPVHDAIPGVDKTTAGSAQNAVLDGEPIGDVDDPASQHEKPVEGDAITNSSAYEEGFQRGRKLWEMGVNAKNIAQQLAETELSESPYSYVTRFQEGVISGFSFQEEVVRDTAPERFKSTDESKKN